jgi:hypothetical protein
MKITIQSTTKIVMLKPSSLADGIPARVWEGETDSGVKVHCFVTRIAVARDEANIEQFEKELKEQNAPSAEIEAYPNRLIL